MNFDTLTNVLLTTLVILLVFVLYKRLLSLLGKKKKNETYTTVESWKFDAASKVLHVNFVVPRKTIVKFEIKNSSESAVITSEETSYDPGKYDFSQNLVTLPAGRYYYKLISTNHEVSQYFEIT